MELKELPLSVKNLSRLTDVANVMQTFMKQEPTDSSGRGNKQE